MKDLTFTASDPEGPGVRLISIQLDGETVYTRDPRRQRRALHPHQRTGSRRRVQRQPAL